jgi:hypothetical protein
MHTVQAAADRENPEGDHSFPRGHCPYDPGDAEATARASGSC